MQLTKMYLSVLEREVERTQRALLDVPEGHDEWKPHPKSMEFGRLVGMIASMPSWVALIITEDELDIAPDVPHHAPPPLCTRDELRSALEKAAESARVALSGTTDVFLETSWTLKAHGKAVSVMSRSDMITDTFAHLAHHRGQLTVYLRLLDATVPALYGPSADDPRYT
ncbi:DinB family protein [Gemmatimonas groenlandica]|uniref:Damage-inducible protein DinB n=1 Tax=Gemmatimonas groenlandica TaxID=2732249 RepID=A0A6M4ISQ2_9BACT|nr:DinB family protein [Gemmatimonas groenlandica]QJR37690.1 damage-inducible protein DinB [Gemmatimonas groenlandica]